MTAPLAAALLLLLTFVTWIGVGGTLGDVC
jgi:hypothetical protein